MSLDNFKNNENAAPQVTHDLQRLREQTNATVEVFLDLADSFSNDGNYEKAISTYGLALAANPFSIEGLNGRGNAYIKTGEIGKAIEDYDAILKIDPNHAKVLTNRGYAYARSGEYEKAIADCEAALRIDPSLEFAKETIEITKETIKSTHNDNAPEVIPEIEYPELGSAETEIGFFRVNYEANKHIDLFRDGYIKALINGGAAYADKGYHDTAITHFSAALEIDSKNADALYNRGTSYYRKGNLDEAIADFTDALKINPNDFAALYNRGVIYVKKGEIGKAIEDNEAALRLSPDNESVKHNLEIARETYKKIYQMEEK